MPAENGMPDNEDVRKKALMRLAVAGVVTAAALAGLWWLDQSGGKQKKDAPEVGAPTPIIAAPPAEARAPATAETIAPPEDSTAAETPRPEQSAPPPDTNPVNPPPPRVSNAPRALTPPPAAMPRPAPSPAAAPQPAPVAGKGYVVQLGVFNNPDNARELVEKLNKQGVRAHLEARVQIGPFLNRQEAEKAQAEMRKLGYNALVTLPYSAPPATK